MSGQPHDRTGIPPSHQEPARRGIAMGQIDDDMVDEYTSKYNSPIDILQGFNTYVQHQEE
eukprot:2052615-Ditylum_brightwellii.AAC.1